MLLSLGHEDTVGVSVIPASFTWVLDNVVCPPLKPMAGSAGATRFVNSRCTCPVLHSRLSRFSGFVSIHLSVWGQAPGWVTGRHW